MPTIQTKPFRIFEAGCGRHPTGLLKKAARSVNKKHRQFFGTDVFASKGLVTRLKARMLRLPKNVKISRDCSVEALERVPAECLDIIFQSYFVNNIGERRFCQKGDKQACTDRFWNAAIDALRPGGRLVLVQDQADVNHYRHIAQQAGMRFSTIRLSDEAMAKSDSWAIRNRSTPKKRAEYLEYYAKAGSDLEKSIRRAITRRAIKTRDEYARPIIMVMQKPRQEKADIQLLKKISPLAKRPTREEIKTAAELIHQSEQQNEQMFQQIAMALFEDVMAQAKKKN